MLTYFILGVTIVISLYAFNEPSLIGKLTFSPYDIKKSNQWYRVISHAFVHADLFHLALNMFVLYQFGKVLELDFMYYFEGRGKFYFFLLYFGAILFSTVLSNYRHQDNPSYHSLGASGAVSAIVFATILIHPWQPLGFFLIPIRIPALIFGLLYISAEIIMDKKANNNVAHDAHFMGALFGIIFLSLLEPAFIKDIFIHIKNYFG